MNNRKKEELVSFGERGKRFPIDTILRVERVSDERLESVHGKFSHRRALLFTSVAPKRRTVSMGRALRWFIFHTLLLSARVTSSTSQFLPSRMKTDVIRVPAAMNRGTHNIRPRFVRYAPTPALKFDRPRFVNNATVGESTREVY